jgi:hypothetical protein
VRVGNCFLISIGEWASVVCCKDSRRTGSSYSARKRIKTGEDAWQQIHTLGDDVRSSFQARPRFSLFDAVLKKGSYERTFPQQVSEPS